MIAALFDLPDAERQPRVVDGIAFDPGPGGTLLAPVCLRPGCGRPWRECRCPRGPLRWEAIVGLGRDGFVTRVREAIGGAR